MRTSRKKAETPATPLPPCDWKDCHQPGECRAPRSRASVGSNRANDYYNFCKDHAAEYNRRWDYFSGMGQHEIDGFRQDAVTGHRPTWSHEERKTSKRFSPEQLSEALRRFEGIAPPPKKAPLAGERALTREQKDALDTLDLPHTSTPKEIKQRYKALVKQLHPDVNNGDRQSEERFKRIVEAYGSLKNLR